MRDLHASCTLASFDSFICVHGRVKQNAYMYILENYFPSYKLSHYFIRLVSIATFCENSIEIGYILAE